MARESEKVITRRGIDPDTGERVYAMYVRDTLTKAGIDKEGDAKRRAMPTKIQQVRIAFEGHLVRKNYIRDDLVTLAKGVKL